MPLPLRWNAETANCTEDIATNTVMPSHSESS